MKFHWEDVIDQISMNPVYHSFCTGIVLGKWPQSVMQKSVHVSIPLMCSWDP